jgi:peptide/nickel transport system permease protein
VPEPGSGIGVVAELPPVHPAAPPDRDFTIDAHGQLYLVVRRFVKHRLAVVGFAVLMILLFAAFLGPRLWHYKYDQFIYVYNHPPSLKYPFGTDTDGKDMLALCLRGLQRSSQVALVVAFISTVFGTVYGAVSGFYRGRIDTIMMRITDLFLTFPVLVVLVVFSHKFGSGPNQWWELALTIAAFSWMPVARLIRGVFLSLREKEFVDAARALGARDSRIIFRHMLPNALGPVIVNATITVAVAVLLESSLSFIGFGIQPPDVSLGQLISHYQDFFDIHWWLFYIPGLLIILLALSINFIGDGLRDALDPQQTRVRA